MTDNTNLEKVDVSNGKITSIKYSKIFTNYSLPVLITLYDVSMPALRLNVDWSSQCIIILFQK